MRLLKAFSIVALVGVFLATSEAMAAAPAQCAAGRELRMYNGGLLKGASLVNSAWASKDVQQQCSNFDTFRTVVLDTFALALSKIPTGAPVSTQCMFIGESDGAKARVEQLRATCEQTCAVDGELIGQMAAILYCDLSIALGGLGMDVDLTGFVSTCGDAFEPACETAFTDQAKEVVECAPYLAGTTFDAVYLQAQHNQCLFEPQAPSATDP
jgi:hypothetical protein